MTTIIAVGGGGAGGAVAPPFGSKRQKSSKSWANGLFIWANSLDIWAHHYQNTVSVSVKTFFFFLLFWRTPSFGQKNRSNFFFLENTSIWAEKTVSILTEKRNASSHFSGKILLPPQIILSSYGHDHYARFFHFLKVKHNWNRRGQ